MPLANDGKPHAITTQTATPPPRQAERQWQNPNIALLRHAVSLFENLLGKT